VAGTVTSPVSIFTICIALLACRTQTTAVSHRRADALTPSGARLLVAGAMAVGYSSTTGPVVVYRD